MKRIFRRKLVLLACGMAAAAFAGGAYAASNDSGSGASQTFLNDVAKRLKVTPAQLHSALQGAFFDRLDAAVAAGRLTKAQAARIKQQVQNDPNFPLGFGHLGFAGPPGGFRGPPGGFGGPPGGPGERHGLHGGLLPAAAKYLALSNTQLMTQLASGKTLAQLANKPGKSAAGLKQALTAAFKAKLDRAVAAKRLTSSQEQQLLSRWRSRLDQLINRRPPRFDAPRGGGLPRFRPPEGPGPAGPPGPPPGAAFTPGASGTPY